MAPSGDRSTLNRGESVKGGNLPFHKSTMTNRHSPPRAEGAQGSFDCRREAPGGPRTGSQLQQKYDRKPFRIMAPSGDRSTLNRGESVKGGNLPFHKSTMTNRHSPPRAEGAQGSFDCRREAPGGPRTGSQLQSEVRPKAIPDHGPVRRPLDPDCRLEAGGPFSSRPERSRRSTLSRHSLLLA